MLWKLWIFFNFLELYLLLLLLFRGWVRFSRTIFTWLKLFLFIKINLWMFSPCTHVLIIKLLWLKNPKDFSLLKLPKKDQNNHKNTTLSKPPLSNPPKAQNFRKTNKYLWDSCSLPSTISTNRKKDSFHSIILLKYFPLRTSLPTTVHPQPYSKIVSSHESARILKPSIIRLISLRLLPLRKHKRKNRRKIRSLQKSRRKAHRLSEVNPWKRRLLNKYRKKSEKGGNYK